MVTQNSVNVDKRHLKSKISRLYLTLVLFDYSVAKLSWILSHTNNKIVRVVNHAESTIDSEGFTGGTRGAPIMPRDAVSQTANVERTGRH